MCFKNLLTKEIEIVAGEPFANDELKRKDSAEALTEFVVSSDVHYEDILAYTYLNEVTQSSIKLYHIVNNSRVLVNNISTYAKDLKAGLAAAVAENAVIKILSAEPDCGLEDLIEKSLSELNR